MNLATHTTHAGRQSTDAAALLRVAERRMAERRSGTREDDLDRGYASFKAAERRHEDRRSIDLYARNAIVRRKAGN